MNRQAQHSIAKAPWLAAAITLLVAGTVEAQTLSGSALVEALRKGGYVLVMRHPNAPREAPGKEAANPDNVGLERQLDETGRSTARAMGEAFKRLQLPVGSVLSSPTYRALEGIRLAGFGEPQTFAELDEGSPGAPPNPAHGEWLRAKAAQRPAKGNLIIMTHTPNLRGAFGQDAAGVAAGESLVFRPDGNGGAALVARVKIEEWPQLAALP
jgi:phosphohistidine phosphatase SixA